MAKFVTLTKIVSERNAPLTDSDEDEMRVAPITTPVDINPDKIRCFYARKDNRPGSRITFSDGGGFVVSESYAQVRAALAGLSVVSTAG